MSIVGGGSLLSVAGLPAYRRVFEGCCSGLYVVLYVVCLLSYIRVLLFVVTIVGQYVGLYVVDLVYCRLYVVVSLLFLYIVEILMIVDMSLDCMLIVCLYVVILILSAISQFLLREW